MTSGKHELRSTVSHRAARSVLPLVVASVVGLGAVPAISGVADAAGALPPLSAGYSVATAPSTGVFTVTGRSWGHRIGMSQVGAQYAGRAGFTTPQIRAHYYPGTKLTALTAAQWPTYWPGTVAGSARPTVRVKLEGNAGSTLTVTSTSGLSLRTATGASAPLPATPAAAVRWRLLPVDAATPSRGLRLQWSGGRTWVTVGDVLPLGSGFSGAVRIELPGGATRTEPTGVSLTVAHRTSVTWTTVSYVDPQTYLASVVAAEIGPSSAPATLGAQAVAARTYASRLAWTYGKTRNWDVCSVTTCQFYPGIATGTVAGGPAKDTKRTFASTTAAVAATQDQVLLYSGAPALTMFAAANGGYTKSGGFPYLPAQADPWDTASGSSSSVWKATLPLSALARLAPSGDRVVAVALGGRDGKGDLGGAPTVVVIDSVSSTGDNHRTTVTPSQVRAQWAWPNASTGLRSTWFAIVGAAPTAGTPTPAPTPTPTTPAPKPTPTTTPVTPSVITPALPLRVGARGPSVVAVQKLLSVTPTGYFGPLTLAAVTAWQKGHRIAATGVVDVATWKGMGFTLPTPVAANPVLLKVGSVGTSVRALQSTLSVRNTGYYGPLTLAAVSAWQKAHALPVTGTVDVRTWNSLGLLPKR